MRKQRNVLQMKRQEKTPKKKKRELNELEASNLLETELKTLAVMMFSGLRERIHDLREIVSTKKEIKKSWGIVHQLKNIYYERK